MSAAVHLLVLTPSLGRVSLGYRDTFAGVTLECQRRGIKLSIVDATDPGYLVHARNVLLAAAVNSSATHALWWDADISFSAASLFELLDRPEAMICRPYPMRAVDFALIRAHVIDGGALDDQHLRSSGERWTTSLAFGDDGKPVWSQDRRLVQVAHCGFGWVLHRVDVLRQFSGGLESGTDWGGRSTLSGFELASTFSGITMGEDVSFCHRWKRTPVIDDWPIWAAPFSRVQNGDHGGTYADYLAAHGLLPDEVRDDERAHLFRLAMKPPQGSP